MTGLKDNNYNDTGHTSVVTLKDQWVAECGATHQSVVVYVQVHHQH